MNTSVRGAPPNASMAAAPVSPDVAPRIVARDVAPDQRPVHRAAQELHGEILERQRRPVEKLQQKQIVVDLHDRRPGRRAEASIGVLRHLAKRSLVEIARRVGRHDPDGGLRVRPAGESGEADRGPFRRRVGRVEPAIPGEARQHRRQKTVARRMTAR
jgi:hypothetical protein